MSTSRLLPGDAGYAAAVAVLVASAQTRGFRLATAEERQYGEARDLYSFSGVDGTLLAPVFVRQEEGVSHDDHD